MHRNGVRKAALAKQTTGLTMNPIRESVTIFDHSNGILTDISLAQV